MFVIGTAGHVDHGKSTLVQALSGINPDRLREEQEREMTIDLGFAWVTLPSGRDVSIVDVPGHEDFIKNMLAGIGGIDLALLVVAADESVMPQTREHLAILDLLEIPRGVVALTRVDLVQDGEWLDLVREEVRDELQGTVLADAPIVPVSAVTGQGLDALRNVLDEALADADERPDLGRPRLPIDRVFTISGFGTVVTGTLMDGRLRVGDEVQIVPGSQSARVRGLQTHKHKVDEAEPGARVAANLTGVARDDLERGQVVTTPGWLHDTLLVDARVRMLGAAPWPLGHTDSVEFFCGSTRVGAYVRLLDSNELQPGESGWIQLRLDEPAALLRGDRYILRRRSPSVTLGGGIIVEPHPRRRHRRFRKDIIQRLGVLLGGEPRELLLELLRGREATEARALILAAGLDRAAGEAALAALLDGGQVVALADAAPERSALSQSNCPVMAADEWRDIVAKMHEALADYHERYPLRLGMPRGMLSGVLKSYHADLGPVIEHAARTGEASAMARVLALPTHEIRLGDADRQALDRAVARLREGGYTPPSFDEATADLGEDLLAYAVEVGEIVRVSDSVAFDGETFRQMQALVSDYVATNGSITVAQVRDLLNTSRKYAMGLLEELDRRHVTKRMGDARVLR